MLNIQKYEYQLWNNFLNDKLLVNKYSTQSSQNICI